MNQQTTIPSPEVRAKVTPEIREAEMCRQKFSHFLRHVKTNDTQRGLGIIALTLFAYVLMVAEAFQRHRLNIVLKPRQMLISWILAAYAVWKCNFFANTDVLIMSENEDKATEIKLRAQLIYENLPDYLKGTVSITGNEINWANGSRLKVLPCTENNARSFSASVIIIDEGAFMKWGSIMFAGIGPAVDVHAQIIIVSTPNGRDALFYQLWNQVDSDFNKIELNWQDHPGRAESWKEKMIRLIGIMRFLREFEKSFAVAAGHPVYGEQFSAQQGIACYKQWNVNRAVHVCFDRGFHHPACVFVQVNAYDQILAIKEIQGEHIDRDKWLEKEVKVQMDAWFPNQYNKGKFIVHIPPDAKEHEADGITWEKAIKNILHLECLPVGDDDIRRRVNATRSKMKLRADNKFGILIDPEGCPILLEGVKGGYAYPENINRPEDEKPHKDDYYDHTANCLELFCDDLDRGYAKTTKLRVTVTEYDLITGRPL